MSRRHRNRKPRKRNYPDPIRRAEANALVAKYGTSSGNTSFYTTAPDPHTGYQKGSLK